MARRDTVSVIRGHADLAAAMREIAGQSAGAPAVFERSVLYPYLWFGTRCNVPTIGGRKEVAIDCLVDGVNGHGATTEAFATDDVIAPDEKRLGRSIESGFARRTAQRTVTHRLGRKLKMIAAFDVKIEARGTVYRRFWILRSGNHRIMVDSVTGSMQPLQASAA